MLAFLFSFISFFPRLDLQNVDPPFIVSHDVMKDESCCMIAVLLRHLLVWTHLAWDCWCGQASIFVKVIILCLMKNHPRHCWSVSSASGRCPLCIRMPLLPVTLYVHRLCGRRWESTWHVSWLLGRYKIATLLVTIKHFAAISKAVSSSWNYIPNASIGLTQHTRFRAQ